MANKYLKIFNEMKYLSGCIKEGVSQARKLYVDTHKIPEDIFNRLIEFDPTPQKKYIEWIAKVYVKGNHDLNQYSVIKDFDELVNKNKIQGNQRDINQYEKPESVYDVVKHYDYDQPSKTEVKKQIKTKESEKVFENENVVVVKPLSRESSEFYGKGTKWCNSCKFFV